MLTFHVSDFCSPNNTARHDSSLKTLTQCSHVKKQTKPFKKEKRSSTILGKGITNQTENAVMLSILYLVTPHCVPSWVFFFNLIIAFQKTRIIERKDIEAGNGTTRGTKWLKKRWIGYMAPQIIENFIESASIHPNVDYIGSSKKWLFIIPHDKKKNTIRRPGTIKRPVSRHLDEELPSTAVEHSSTGAPGARRSGKESFFILVSTYTFPWSLLMATAKQERWTLDMTQHGSSQMVLEHTSLATQPGVPTNHRYIQPEVLVPAGNAEYIISC